MLLVLGKIFRNVWELSIKISNSSEKYETRNKIKHVAFINACDSIAIFFDPNQYKYLLTQEEYGQAQTEEQRPLELVVSHVSGAGGGASAGGQEAAQCACAATGHRVIT